MEHGPSATSDAVSSIGVAVLKTFIIGDAIKRGTLATSARGDSPGLREAAPFRRDGSLSSREGAPVHGHRPPYLRHFCEASRSVSERQRRPWPPGPLFTALPGSPGGQGSGDPKLTVKHDTLAIWDAISSIVLRIPTENGGRAAAGCSWPIPGSPGAGGGQGGQS